MVSHSLFPSERSLHIAVVTETYPPEVNGVAMSMARVVQGLTARRHVIDVIRPRQSDPDNPADTVWQRSMLTASWPVPGYPKLRMGVPCKGRLVQRWRAERPDVVHIATEGPRGWAALRAARPLRLPAISKPAMPAMSRPSAPIVASVPLAGTCVVNTSVLASMLYSVVAAGGVVLMPLFR